MIELGLCTRVECHHVVLDSGRLNSLPVGERAANQGYRIVFGLLEVRPVDSLVQITRLDPIVAPLTSPSLVKDHYVAVVLAHIACIVRSLRRRKLPIAD